MSYAEIIEIEAEQKITPGGELPLFGGPLVSASLAPEPEQPTLAHVCRACLGTGRANIGTKRNPRIVWCFCAAGARAFEEHLRKENDKL